MPIWSKRIDVNQSHVPCIIILYQVYSDYMTITLTMIITCAMGLHVIEIDLYLCCFTICRMYPIQVEITMNQDVIPSRINRQITPMIEVVTATGSRNEQEYFVLLLTGSRNEWGPVSIATQSCCGQHRVSQSQQGSALQGSFLQVSVLDSEKQVYSSQFFTSSSFGAGPRVLKSISTRSKVADIVLRAAFSMCVCYINSFWLEWHPSTYFPPWDMLILMKWRKLIPWMTHGIGDDGNSFPYGSFHVKSTQKRNWPPPIFMKVGVDIGLSLIHIWRCRRIERCRSRWSPYH